MTPLVKICGLSTPESLDAALDAGADLVGFVRYPRSPRHVGLEQGRLLSRRAAGRALRVLLVVDADDAALDEAVEAVAPDWLQLHGTETPERVTAVRGRYGRPVLKAIGVAGPGDLARARAYEGAADRLLLDARPPAHADALPGGNGLPFDWRLLEELDPAHPFMLSGGLRAGNVAEAIAVTRPWAVDVSSGVERRPGEKDPRAIAAFVAAARAASSPSSERVA